MRIRQGFVSNSSSTSFIVPAHLSETAKEQGLELYKVSDLIKRMAEITLIIEKSEMASGAYPSFLGYEFFGMMPYYHRLVELENKNPGCYITEPFDRDRAYEMGIDMHYSTFEEDL